MDDPYQSLTKEISEREFCGAIIKGDTKASDSGLKAEWFTIPFCRRIFEAALALERQGRPCDIPTLEGVISDDDLEQAIVVATETVTTALAEQQARNIREAAMRKALIKTCLDTVKSANDGEISTSELLNGAVVRLNELGGQTDDGDIISGTDALCGFYTRLTSGAVEPVAKTGFPKLDQSLLIAGGKLIVVGARPSVGKSALLLHMAVRALDAGRRILLVSCEMGADEVVGRVVAQKSGVSVDKIERHDLTEDEIIKVADSFAEIPSERFCISERARTVQDIRRMALRTRAHGGLDLIVADYLQLLDAGQKTNNRAEAVGVVTRGLKALAMELKIPVLTASQLNRASERNDEPKLSDLRESGSIEQDADAVLLLHAPNDKDDPERKLFLDKNRGGRCGRITLYFDGATMRFTEMQGG